MIVVLDTNVIISALLSPSGTPAEIVKRWEKDEFELATSAAFLDELRRALTYPQVLNHLNFSEDQVAHVIKRLQSVATVVDPQPTVDVVKEDPADNQVLACAVKSRADYIVSGDAHLLKLKAYQQTTILAPFEFLVLLDGRRENGK